MFVIGREAGDEGHIGSFRNGNGWGILLFGQKAAGLDGAPAAVHEKQALPVMKEGGDFFDDALMVCGVGAYHEDVRFLHGLFKSVVKGTYRDVSILPLTVRGDWFQQAALMRFLTYT